MKRFAKARIGKRDGEAAAFKTKLRGNSRNNASGGGVHTLYQVQYWRTHPHTHTYGYTHTRVYSPPSMNGRRARFRSLIVMCRNDY